MKRAQPGSARMYPPQSHLAPWVRKRPCKWRAALLETHKSSAVPMDGDQLHLGVLDFGFWTMDMICGWN